MYVSVQIDNNCVSMIMFLVFAIVEAYIANYFGLNDDVIDEGDDD